MSIARKFAIAAGVAAVGATALILAISLPYDPTPGGMSTDRTNDRNMVRVVVTFTALSLPTLASIAGADRHGPVRPCIVLLLVSAAATGQDQ